MSIPAFSQLLANKALTEKELAELLKTAKTVPVMEKNCMRYTMVDQKTNLVFNQTIVSKYIFTYLGLKEVRLEFDTAKNKENFVGFLGAYRHSDGSLH